jgi:glycerol-3-phosphate dehydrogenase (NAD(P)+)
MAKVAVIGAGAWGLALADYLARHGKLVVVWDREATILNQLRLSHTVGRPAGLVVHGSVEYADTIVEAVDGAAVILNVIPSFAVADLCGALAPLSWQAPGAVFVNCSKGIEQDTLRLPCEVFETVIGERGDLRYGVLAGPSHAEEVSRDVPTAVVVSAKAPDDAVMLQQLFNSQTFRVYLQSDYLGVELGGALKNVIAVAAGICHGKSFGDNTKAMLITRALAEMGRLAGAMGANPDTMSGLSGLGDLIVTTMSEHSRNRTFGALLAAGNTPQQALEKVGAVVEGYKTAKSAHDLAVKHKVDMPIVRSIYQVLYEELPLDAGIALLLDRDVKRENVP